MRVPCVKITGVEESGLDGVNVRKLKEMNTENEEGFVLASHNGKMKIKFENYLKKFRTKYMYSDKRIAEDWFKLAIRKSDIDSYIKDIDADEEIGISAREIINELWDRYNRIYKDTMNEYYHIMCYIFIFTIHIYQNYCNPIQSYNPLLPLSSLHLRYLLS